MSGLEVRDVTMRIGGIVALEEVSFDVPSQTVCALIGPNGAGKTTLFNVVTGLYTPTAGSVRLDGEEVVGQPPYKLARRGVARTFQNLALWHDMTVLENVLCGAYHRSRQGIPSAVLGLKRRHERLLDAEARSLLDLVGLADLADQPCKGLPYGTLKRVELARALASAPRLLLLDEPATGLTQSEVDELADLIKSVVAERGLGLLIVEHHMGMVMRLAEKVVVLNRGRNLAEGTPDEVQTNPAVVEAYLGTPA